MCLLFFETPYNQVINNCLVPILLSRWYTILHTTQGRTIPIVPTKALSVNKYVGKMNCKIQIKSNSGFENKKMNILGMRRMLVIISSFIFSCHKEIPWELGSVINPNNFYTRQWKGLLVILDGEATKDQIQDDLKISILILKKSLL